MHQLTRHWWTSGGYLKGPVFPSIPVYPVYLSARPAVRASAAQGSASLHRERASTCGLNKGEIKEIKTQLMTERHEASPETENTHRIPPLI